MEGAFGTVKSELIAGESVVAAVIRNVANFCQTKIRLDRRAFELWTTIDEVRFLKLLNLSDFYKTYTMLRKCTYEVACFKLYEIIGSRYRLHRSSLS